MAGLRQLLDQHARIDVTPKINNLPLDESRFMSNLLVMNIGI